MNYSTAEIWAIIILMAIGTYMIRFSFLGPLSNTKLPEWMMRLLRYTPVAVIPGLAAPMVLWPDATGGEPNVSRIVAALTAAVLGYYLRSSLAAIIGGGAMLYLMLYLVG